MAKKSDLQRRVLIGRKLAMARDMAQLRQEDVALEIFGTPHKNRMSEIENGKLMPDAELLSVLCQKYGVSSDWVLGFTVEPELDKTASVAGILFNSLGDMMSEYTQAMAFQLSMAAAQHVTSFPKALTVQLLTASKELIQACLTKDQAFQDKVLPELQTLMLIVRECEQNRAKQIRNLEMAIDDVFQRDESDIQEKALIDLIKNKKRFSKASLQQQAIAEVKQIGLFSE
ncbi:helix-turn-helix transcriptional regulator [Acinetobacter baumannii]|uniref:Helix-turn-helix transcriptional regulator n=1 Tax=Acinetobacter oleivorans TaxID=1148157 RepID=A0ABR9NKA3_9GAMM|nr:MULTISPECIES: helix-turn-helix transcriptional regulator [Acinetobacter]MBE2165351.1 helix-turn-helix transcriptional regulator [Acinetobacter oleivorans]MDH2493663.1 helix-turn-helix transcriptional regulator [Acinetobacter baumannii]